MAEKFQFHDEVIVSTKETTVAVHRGVAGGKLRKLASRLYTTNPRDTPEAIIQRNVWRIVAGFYPGALLADRTAIENRPAADGSVFLVHSKTTALELPGLRIRPRRGTGPQEGDRQFVHGLYIASTARAYLENLRPSRARSGAARTLPKDNLVAHLDALLRASGEDALNRLRDEARRLAPGLGLEEEAQQFDTLIGALLGTRKAKLDSALGAAYAAGAPYDVERMEGLEVLRQALAIAPPSHIAAKATDGVALPFFEAYFSNYIEGTEFAVEEAEEIIFQGKVPAHRPKDAHDILGTFDVVRSEADMRRVPATSEEFVALLCARHARMMGGRPELAPGVFKAEPNRAGNSLFVHPRHVRGTLLEGFALGRTLPTAFARAVFMMFLVAEVHPFADGNGRAARVMMNAEFVAAGEARIIIPTVFKALTHNRRTGPLTSVLAFAWRYTHQIDFSSLKTARAGLTATHAFEAPADALGAGAKLVLPASLPR